MHDPGALLFAPPDKIQAKVIKRRIAGFGKWTDREEGSHEH